MRAKVLPRNTKGRLRPLDPGLIYKKRFFVHQAFSLRAATSGLVYPPRRADGIWLIQMIFMRFLAFSETHGNIRQMLRARAWRDPNVRPRYPLWRCCKRSCTACHPLACEDGDAHGQKALKSLHLDVEAPLDSQALKDTRAYSYVQSCSIPSLAEATSDGGTSTIPV